LLFVLKVPGGLLIYMSFAVVIPDHGCWARESYAQDFFSNLNVKKLKSAKTAMKTYLAKTGELCRDYILVDATEAKLGRLAVKIANALRGKDRPTYTPHVDAGRFVVVINAEKVALSGSKDERKLYEDYSGYRSGHKYQSAERVRANKPERMIKDAVWGMLPHGRLGRAIFRKLKVYAGPEHPHVAQKPEQVTL